MQPVVPDQAAAQADPGLAVGRVLGHQAPVQGHGFRLPAAHTDNRREVAQTGDGNDVLMHLQGDPQCVGFGVGHYIRQHVRNVGAG